MASSTVTTKGQVTLPKEIRDYLHVSAGIGTSKYAPFRFLCRPEATLIELRPASHAHDSRSTTRSKTRS